MNTTDEVKHRDDKECPCFSCSARRAQNSWHYGVGTMSEPRHGIDARAAIPCIKELRAMLGAEEKKG